MDSKIPVIDFSRFLEGSISERQQTITEVDRALRTVGSFRLVKHGIPESKIDKCFEWVSEYIGNAISWNSSGIDTDHKGKRISDFTAFPKSRKQLCLMIQNRSNLAILQFSERKYSANQARRKATVSVIQKMIA